MRKNFIKKAKSMLAVDFRRMFTTNLIYILIGVAFVVPILILVMTSMMDGMVTTDQNGNQTIVEGFKNVWQIISSSSSASTDVQAGAGLDMMSMCNMNLLYFAVAVLVCLFISADFRSGYAKNIFTVRSSKVNYVLSKTVVCFVGGALMIIAFFIGALIGGAVAGVSFDLASVGSSVGGIITCLITKILLVMVFVAIFVVFSVIAKSRAWLGILLSLGVGMFMFMMIPLMTPLNANLMHVILCLAGGVTFGVGLGAVSNVILKKTNLV